MTPSRSSFLTFARVAMLAACLFAGVAFADEYADVNQLMRSGKPVEAMARADQYIAAHPRDPQMRFIKGVLLSETGHPSDAIAVFTALTQEYPELPEPYNNLAVLHAANGDYEKARASLEDAVRTNPSYSTAFENLGDVYAALASRSWAKAQQLDPANAAVKPKLAMIRELLSASAKTAKPAARPGT